MSKSLEEIQRKLEADKIKTKIEREEQEAILEEQNRKARIEWIKKNELFEALNQQSNNTTTSSSAGGNYIRKWKTIIDTIWLYPIAELEWAKQNGSVSFSQSGSDLIFATLTDLTDFYDTVYLRTSVTQPVGNVGYSLGVGTILRGSRDRINLRLSTGQIVVTWELMTQITSQSDLPSGGDSPDGTIGYGSIYSDYDLDGLQDPSNYTPPGFNDPLRFQQI
jgi:hypothetical protein